MAHVLAACPGSYRVLPRGFSAAGELCLVAARQASLTLWGSSESWWMDSNMSARDIVTRAGGIDQDWLGR